jgi:tRNA dimethylallyltransferase
LPGRLLDERSDRRVDDIVGLGLFGEVEGLLRAGVDPGCTALKTVGYQEPIRYLRGEITREEAINLMKQHTRNFAKRQLTWFRKESRIRWFDCGSEDEFCETSKELASWLAGVARN